MFFFFKQKTAYEMRISDWSSDVCSSDLPCAVGIVDAGFTHQTGGVDGDALSLPGSLCLRSAVVASHGFASTRGRSKDIKCLAVAGFWLRIGGVRFQPGNVFELEKFGDRIRADRKSVVSGKSVSGRVAHEGRRHII